MGASLGFPIGSTEGCSLKSFSLPPQNPSRSRQLPTSSQQASSFCFRELLESSAARGRSSFGRCRQTEQLLSICSAAHACVSNCVFRTKALLRALLARSNLNKSSLLRGFLLCSGLPGFPPLVCRWLLSGCSSLSSEQCGAKSGDGPEGPGSFVARDPPRGAATGTPSFSIGISTEQDAMEFCSQRLMPTASSPNLTS